MRFELIFFNSFVVLKFASNQYFRSLLSTAFRATKSIGKIAESLFLVPPAGVEPATYSLEGSRSIQLSYEGNDR